MKSITTNRKPVAMAVGGAVAAAMCAAALAPVAFADTTASTDVTLQATSENLSVTAPMEIPFAMGADGAFTGPSADAAVIDNGSSFPVKVESFEWENATGTAVSAAEFASTDEANAWYATMAPNGGTAIDMNQSADALDSSWNMGADGADDTIELETAGAMKNIDGSIDFSVAQELGTITWTFSAGQNA